MRPRILLSAVCLLCLQLCCLAQDVQSRAEAMIQHARDLSDIRSANAPAFRLSATFSFVGSGLETVEGTYSEVWISGEQWRSETVVNGLRRVEVAGPKSLWLLDTGDQIPDRASQVAGLLRVLPFNSATLKFESIKESIEPKLEAECAVTK